MFGSVKGLSKARTFGASLAFALISGAFSTGAAAQEPLRISIWGGSWKDFVAENIGKRFTAETGVPVEYITGGTIDRLNKAKLSKANPRPT